MSIYRKDPGVGASCPPVMQRYCNLAVLIFFSLYYCKLGSDQVGDA